MKQAIGCFEDLVAWQKARRLVTSIYRATREDAFARDFTLVGQIRKAAISVPSNLAEGFERNGLRQFQHFVAISRGSCAEVRTQLYLALDLGYLTEKQFTEKMEEAREVGRIMGGLSAALDRKLLVTKH
jgi:four helix bundle protein